MTKMKWEKFAKRFARDVSGGVMIWAAVGAPVMVSGGALAVDVSRVYNLDQQMQSAADSAARAAAAELDGKSDSLTRANRAMTTLVSNSETFSDNSGAVAVQSVRFLTEQPANSYEAADESLVTTDPHAARYVEVTLAPRNVKTLFPPKLSKGLAKVSLQSTSTAGFSFGTRGGQPMFVCNPYEGSNVTIFEAADDPNELRRQIRLVNPGGGNGKFVAGTWGYLDPFSQQGSTSANDFKDIFAIDVPNTYFTSSGVRVRSGKIAGIDEAINTRFDMFKGKFKKSEYTDNPRFAPARNVVKGHAIASIGNSKKKKTVNACASIETSSAFALPRDGEGNTLSHNSSANANATATIEGDFIGEGNWDFVEYVRVNHNWARQMNIYGTTYQFNYVSGTVSPSTPPSRYEMYRWEIEFDCVPGAQTYGQNNVNTAEEGIPMCHSMGGYEGDIDRRVVTAAIINCGAQNDIQSMTSNNRGPVPVEAFGKFFLTEPVGVDAQTEMYVEFVGLLEGTDVQSRDQIALAR